jgi:hypothetical protein
VLAKNTLKAIRSNQAAIFVVHQSNKLTMKSVAIFLLLITVLSSCKHERESQGTDAELYELAKATSGFVWYKQNSNLLDKSAGSGHPQPFLRTRYNSIAATQLDSDGKVRTDAVFANGSLIVKELHASASSLARYAILYKNPLSEDADSRGWVWGYIDADGNVAQTASNKGSACISCHSQEGSIDYTLMNISFP